MSLIVLIKSISDDIFHCEMQDKKPTELKVSSNLFVCQYGILKQGNYWKVITAYLEQNNAIIWNFALYKSLVGSKSIDFKWFEI